MIAALRGLGHEVLVIEPTQYSRAPFGEEPVALSRIKRNVPRIIFELFELGYNVPAFFRLLRGFTNQNFDVIYERYNLYLLAGLWTSRLKRIPLLLEVNAPLAAERRKFGGVGLPRLATYLEQWAWRSATHVLPVTQVLANIMMTAGVPGQRITVIGNGIDEKRFANAVDSRQAKSAMGLGGKLVLGFTGFIREWHRLEIVFDILARDVSSTALHFLVVGDGPARRYLEERVQELQLQSKVTFLGVVDPKSIANAIAAFDIALQPAAVDYASPLKLFEYMALGKAIVAPDQANIREVLTHGLNALLFSPDSMEEMTRSIERLIGNDELRERLGRAASSTLITRRLTWIENAKRISDIAIQSTSIIKPSRSPRR